MLPASELRKISEFWQAGEVSGFEAADSLEREWSHVNERYIAQLKTILKDRFPADVILETKEQVLALLTELQAAEVCILISLTSLID